MLRIALFLLCGLLAAGLLYTGSQAAATLARLDVVEQERDRWQRPSEIIQALNLKEGAVVVDLGCGAGYFALKLSPLVGSRGKVLAVDLRKVSLAFLWTRALLRNQGNLTVMLGDVDDPHLTAAADAVLIVNSYHELTQPKPMLDRLRRSLVSGGRLVITDRNHLRSRMQVEEEIRGAGFEVVRREDPFLEQPGEGPWWLIVAQKP